MKKVITKILSPFYKRYHFWLHRKPRKYSYKNVYTIVLPSVFSPVNTISTKVFLDYISKLDLEQKQVLELGCGSGIISIFSASKGAIVTATDINQTALNSLEKVSFEQDLKLNCLYSDLFKNINKKFDYIFINPPYYPKNPKNTEEQAWFCGNDFEYFKDLFFQLTNQYLSSTKVYMILSDACNLNEIKKIATKNKLELVLVHTKKLLLEENYIFEINQV